MQTPPGPFVVALLALAVAAHAADATAPLDLGKRAESVATNEQAVLPENRPIERNEVVGERRFETSRVEKKQAIVGERRSEVKTEESRPKKLFRSPEVKRYEVRDRQESVWSGKRARISTSDTTYRTNVATRFQDKIADATPLPNGAKPVVADKRASFERVNRFAFRRNGGVEASVAGSTAAPRDLSETSSLARPPSR